MFGRSLKDNHRIGHSAEQNKTNMQSRSDLFAQLQRQIPGFENIPAPKALEEHRNMQQPFKGVSRSNLFVQCINRDGMEHGLKTDDQLANSLNYGQIKVDKSLKGFDYEFMEKLKATVPDIYKGDQKSSKDESTSHLKSTSGGINIDAQRSNVEPSTGAAKAVLGAAIPTISRTGSANGQSSISSLASRTPLPSNATSIHPPTDVAASPLGASQQYGTPTPVSWPQYDYSQYVSVQPQQYAIAPYPSYPPDPNLLQGASQSFSLPDYQISSFAEYDRNLSFGHRSPSPKYNRFSDDDSFDSGASSPYRSNYDQSSRTFDRTPRNRSERQRSRSRSPRRLSPLPSRFDRSNEKRDRNRRCVQSPSSRKKSDDHRRDGRKVSPFGNQHNHERKREDRRYSKREDRKHSPFRNVESDDYRREDRRHSPFRNPPSDDHRRENRRHPQFRNPQSDDYRTEDRSHSPFRNSQSDNYRREDRSHSPFRNPQSDDYRREDRRNSPFRNPPRDDHRREDRRYSPFRNVHYDGRCREDRRHSPFIKQDYGDHCREERRHSPFRKQRSDRPDRGGDDFAQRDARSRTRHDHDVSCHIKDDGKRLNERNTHTTEDRYDHRRIGYKEDSASRQLTDKSYKDAYSIKEGSRHSAVKATDKSSTRDMHASQGNKIPQEASLVSLKKLYEEKNEQLNTEYNYFLDDITGKKKKNNDSMQPHTPKTNPLKAVRESPVPTNSESKIINKNNDYSAMPPPKTFGMRQPPSQKKSKVNKDDSTGLKNKLWSGPANNAKATDLHINKSLECKSKAELIARALASNIESKPVQINVEDPRTPSLTGQVNELIVNFVRTACKSKGGVRIVAKKYHLPRNCIGLVPPKMTQEVWDLLKLPTQTRDYTVQDVQRWLALGIMPIILQIDMFGRGEQQAKDVCRMTSDSITVLAHVCNNMSIKRRILMRGALNKKYAVLCQSHLEVTGYLFGDSLLKDLMEIRSTTYQCKPTPEEDSDDMEAPHYKPTFFSAFATPGPDVDINVANMINMACANDGDVEDLKDKFKIPTNCDLIIPAKINPEIWSLLSRSGIDTDYRLQDVQLSVAESMVPLMRILESVYEKRYDACESLGMLTDALALLGNTIYQLNKVRMNNMLKKLPESVHGFCQWHWPGAEQISGEKLKEELRTCSDFDSANRAILIRGLVQ